MRNRFLIFACLLSASCSSLLPIAEGHYEPIAVEATADRLPVRLRSVGLDHCHFDKMDGVGASVPLTPAERESVRRGLQETLAGDIVRDGPLRTAAAGEGQLVVDVEVLRLALPVRSGSTVAMQVFLGLFLFVPTLIGVPIASLSEVGDATFTVYDQDGLTELC